MNEIIQQQRDELREAGEKATPRPWRFWEEHPQILGGEDTTLAILRDEYAGDITDENRPSGLREKNGRYIALAANLALSLLDALERAEAELASARKVIDKFTELRLHLGGEDVELAKEYYENFR